MTNKTIYQLWGGEDSIPEDYQECVDTMIDINKNYTHELWSDSSTYDHVHDVIEEYDVPYDEYEHDIARWDMLRIMLIYKNGGMCCDLDMRCGKELDPSIFKKSCGFLYENHLISGQNRCLHNPFMYCERFSKFFEYILRWSRYNYNKAQDLPKSRYVAVATGPDMLTSMYHMYKDKNEVNLIPPEDISPYLTHLHFRRW
mgnify:CR=1 FL=1|jgi:inositol phosphorylceramide mannosyltransferase catalytic subunit